MDERDDSNDPLVGNPALAEFASSEGFSTSTSSMQKYTSPAINTGPKLIGYYGKLPTSTKGLVRTWIKSRMRPVRQVTQSNQEAAVATIDTSDVTADRPKRGRRRKVVPEVDTTASTITTTSAAPPSAGDSE